MGIELAAIKAKWSSLRAQHGRELAKENKTKSRQSADDLYESKWAFMEKMHFVEQIKKTVKSKSTIQVTDGNESENEEETLQEMVGDDEEG